MKSEKEIDEILQLPLRKKINKLNLDRRDIRSVSSVTRTLNWLKGKDKHDILDILSLGTKELVLSMKLPFSDNRSAKAIRKTLTWSLR